MLVIFRPQGFNNIYNGSDMPEQKLTHPPTHQFCVVVASNNDSSLKHNLMASDMISSEHVPLHIERNAESAALAYNHGIDSSTAPIIIFAHQDVYFPPGWERRLCDAITTLEKQDPNWALLAPFGMTDDGEHIGPVWSSSLGRIVGRTADVHELAQSFDELVIVMRRASGLRFDTKLPGFHMYGTDIVQTARARGLGAYVCALPLVHNDEFHGLVHQDFSRAYHFMRHKWRNRLPLRTPILWVTRYGMPLYKGRLLMRTSYTKRQAIALDTGKPPQHYSAVCGWE